MLKKKLALFMVMIILASSVIGCGQKSAPPPEKPSEATPEAPPKRDSIHLAAGRALVSVDPHNNRAVADVEFHNQIFEPLLHRNEITTKFEPRIAENYTVSDDGLVYTFKIRQNVKFHNGDPVKASDCVFSYERAIKAPVLKAFVASVEEVSAPDDYTFVVKLKGGSNLRPAD